MREPSQSTPPRKKRLPPYHTYSSPSIRRGAFVVFIRFLEVDSPPKVSLPSSKFFPQLFYLI